MIDHNFFDVMAKIMPSKDSTVNTVIATVTFAFGPLMIKKNIILMIAVNRDKTPNIFFLFKSVTSLRLARLGTTTKKEVLPHVITQQKRGK